MILKKVKKYVGEIIYFRGLNYYRRNHILHFLQKDNTIFAKVQGRGSNIYSIEISITDDTLEKASCNCPYGALCKHIAAVLISYCLEKQEKELINPLQAIREQKYPDKIIPLIQKNSKSSSGSDFIKSIINNKFPLSRVKNKQRWRLVFYMLQQYYYFLETVTYWAIAPALQYIRQDGKMGRIIKWRADLVTEKVKANQLALLNKLMEAPARADKLTSYLDWIIKNKDLPLFTYLDYKYIPIVFKELKNTHIQFQLHKIDKNTPIFKPVLTLCSNKDHTMNTDNTEIHILKTMEYLVLICSNGTLFFKQNKGHTSNLLYKLLKRKGYFTPQDINILKEYLKTHRQNELKVIFPAQNIRLIKQPPQSILEIKRSPPGQLLYISIIFSYTGREITSEDNEDNKEILILAHEAYTKEILISKRHKNIETKVVQYLRKKLGEHLDNRSFWNNDRYQLAVNLSMPDFLLKYGEVLLKEGYEIKIEGKPLRLLSYRGKFSIAVTSGIDWLDMQYNYYDEEGRRQDVSFDPEYLEKGLLATSQGFILLTYKYIKRLKQLLEQGLNKDGSLRVSKLNFSLIEKLSPDVDPADLAPIIDTKKIYEQLKDFHKIKAYPLARHFKAKLRNYQKAGFFWLHFLCDYNLSGCLADDMGLGKTVQTLALLSSLKEKKLLKTILLVVPVTTIANWESEIQRFAPYLNYYRHAGPKRNKDISYFNNYDIIIVSYQTLRIDIKYFKEYTFFYIILDESQAIKNANSQIFKAIRLLKADHRLSLTGTPIENNTLELWAQMEFLNPGLLGNLKSFKKRFSRPIEIKNDRDAIYRLKKLIFPFILRRKKQDVATELPPKEEIVLYTEMGTKQNKLYGQLRTYYKEKIKTAIEMKELSQIAIEFFAALLRLRQCVLFPGLISYEFNHIDSCKFESLKELVSEIIQEEHKVLIFSQFVGSLKKIRKYIEGQNIKYSYLDGSTKNRKKEIQNFQTHEDIPIFLLSLKAGGVGINLTAADYVILFDPWWNPAVETQAVDRSHRIGQTKKVIVYKMIVKDTVEEKILKLQAKKKELTASLITEEARFFKSLTKEDILQIFE